MSAPDRILVIHLRQLGDVLLTSALLEDLRQAYPDATIDFLTSARAEELVRGNPFASEIIVFDRARPMQSVRDLRMRRYELVFDFQASMRTALITLAVGAPRRVGWDKRGRALAYTECAPRTFPEEYVVRQRQRLLEFAGIAVHPRRPRIYLDSEERAGAAKAVAALQTPKGAPRVGLVLNARAVGATWPVERFAELATRLASGGAAPVVLSTIDDDARVKGCLRLAPGTVRGDFRGLRQFAAALGAFDLIVSGDTGPAHFAMAVGTPTVTLYGAASATLWNPGLPTTVAVSSPRAQCAACARRASRLDTSHTCMREIDVPAVEAAVRGLLASVSAPAALRTIVLQ